MKFVRYCKGEQTSWGVLDEKGIRRVDGNIFSQYVITPDWIPTEEVRFLAPVMPSKVIGMGINYHDFIEKMNIPKPESPYIFLKAPSTIIGPEEEIRIPGNDAVNFEAELVAVIKDRCRNVPESEALDHVLGYTICNDLTDRTDLLRDGHMGISKNYDTFLPVGPAVETEMDWQNVKIRLEQNGQVKIDGNTDQMIFRLPYQIAFISRIMTLEPGDIILTGSPAGAGPIQRGDELSITIEPIGTLHSWVAEKQE